MSTILRPIVRHKSLTGGPTSGSWSKLLFSLGTTPILRALAVLREYVLRGVCTASILSVSRCYVYFTLSAKKHLFCGNIFCMCWILLSRSQSIVSQPRPRVPFCAHVYAASIGGLIAASHLFRINIHLLPVHPLYYCSSNYPKLLLPQTASVLKNRCVCSSRY